MLHSKWTRIEAPANITHLEIRNDRSWPFIFRPLNDDVQAWLDENIGDFVQYPQDVSDLVMYIGSNGRDKIILKFKNSEHALHFKLAWC